MKIAYFDCIAGASGDMILGALLDAGLSEADLKEHLSNLHLPVFDLRSQRVVKQGISAVRVDVLVADELPERRLPEIKAVIQESDLIDEIKTQAIHIFDRLGEAEASIHGIPTDQVHLHELGGLDTIVDVIGALAGLRALGIGRAYASPLPLGRGFTSGAHGRIPLPAPATLALLKGVPVVGSDVEMELVTPTAAALLSSLVESYGPTPAMTLGSVGYGAGSRDLPIPNVLRLLVGAQAVPGLGTYETLVSLETNIDDLNPQVYEHVMARLFEAGALDVTLSPLQMKKNRPGTQLWVLCRPEDADAMAKILLAETSTLGVRRQRVERLSLTRSMETVQTPYGPVRVKIARLDPEQEKIKPEYEDCRRLAQEKQVPLGEVIQAAEFAARTQKLT
ncbi:MAG TPA: nickel pincer cofactor biosynthesis protein LarC [Anaerolineales bacterium]|jgi:uncharacterized protein (TIGR00299 family) protein|nr:nickel pincer cofactor biosynthesis protein LarC [Anaerolineales bacterium]